MDMLLVPSYHHIDIRDGDAWKQVAIDVLVHDDASADIDDENVFSVRTSAPAQSQALSAYIVDAPQAQKHNGQEVPKVLPWVHVAISNAKALLKDMCHEIKEEFLQSYLDEFCYKFKRMYFGNRTFD